MKQKLNEIEGIDEEKGTDDEFSGFGGLNTDPAIISGVVPRKSKNLIDVAALNGGGKPSKLDSGEKKLKEKDRMKQTWILISTLDLQNNKNKSYKIIEISLNNSIRMSLINLIKGRDR